MRKVKGKTLAVTGILLSIVVLFLLEEHFRGEIALNARFKQLAAQGGKLDYRELLPPKPSPEQNAAVDLIALTNDLKPFFTLATDAPLSMEFIAPGRAKVSWRQDWWLVDKNSSNSWEKFSPKVAAAGPVLARLETVWTKTGFDEGVDYEKGFLNLGPMPILICSKQTSVLLSEAVKNDLRHGELEAARKHLHSLLAISHALGKEPLIISQLVGIACSSIAFGNTWEALQKDGWTDTQLGDLQTAWTSLNDFPLAMAKSFEMERAMTVDYFRQIRASNAKASSALAMGESMQGIFSDDSDSESGGLPVHGFLLYHVHLPVWQLAWAAQDELHSLEKWMLIVDGGKSAATGSWAEAARFFPGFDGKSESFFPFSVRRPKSGLYNRCRFLFSEEPFSVDAYTVLRPLKFETEKNLAITAIALKRYQLRHGKSATQLSDLVPEFLSSLPLDRMDGKPLHYHLNADGSFKLYSVGLNGIDDGGNPEPEQPLKEFRNIWQGRDAVWPAAAN